MSKWDCSCGQKCGSEAEYNLHLARVQPMDTASEAATKDALRAEGAAQEREKIASELLERAAALDAFGMKEMALHNYARTERARRWFAIAGELREISAALTAGTWPAPATKAREEWGEGGAD